MPALDVMLNVLAGAVAGGAGGLLLSRARLCSGESCHAKANVIFSIIAGALFGAAVAWYLINRGPAA